MDDRELKREVQKLRESIMGAAALLCSTMYELKGRTTAARDILSKMNQVATENQKDYEKGEEPAA